MTSILKRIKHYQTIIDKSVKDAPRLLYCLEKLNTLPIKMKYLQETRVGRTVNNLREHDGLVGHRATALVAKWKREIVAQNAQGNDKDERMYKDDTGNIQLDTRKNHIDSQDNCTSSTTNSDTQDQTVNKSMKKPCCSTDNSTSVSSCSRKKSRKNGHIKIFGSDQSGSSISRSSDERESISSVRSEYDGVDRVKIKNSKRKNRGETNNPKRNRESDLIDIDSTMGTSFAEALGMLDVLSACQAKKIPNDKSSLREASTSSQNKKFGKSFLLNEKATLLSKRPQLERPLGIDVESSMVTEPGTCALRPPQKQTNHLTDEPTTNMIARTSKTKVFSGKNARFKCKVATLFDMCIRILQNNINLLEFIGGVPFDILRPVLERATCEQLIILEDYNPYLIEDTHCLWEQHCKRRFRTKSREELETWREMYIRCLEEEQAKFNSLTAIIKLSKERLTKPAYVDTHLKATKNAKALSHTGWNNSSVGQSGNGSQKATKSNDSKQIRKRSKNSTDDPDWTPTNWYKTLYKKPAKEPKPPKPPIKKTIDILRYDRAKALEKKKEEWKKRRRYSDIYVDKSIG